MVPDMTATERSRRHDERWQHEVLDALARMLDVLHDISGATGVKTVPGTTELQPPAEHPPKPDQLLWVSPS